MCDRIVWIPDGNAIDRPQRVNNRSTVKGVLRHHRKYTKLPNVDGNRMLSNDSTSPIRLTIEWAALQK